MEPAQADQQAKAVGTDRSLSLRRTDPARALRHPPVRLARRYNPHMVFLEFLMRVLEVMFFLGLAGSTVVVLISFFEDGKELFGKD